MVYGAARVATGMESPGFTEVPMNHGGTDDPDGKERPGAARELVRGDGILAFA